MSSAVSNNKPKKRGSPAATSIEHRENQLINKAVDLAEKQLMDGTASAQVITHFLKLGTSRALLEKAKLENENALLAAKTEAIQSHKRTEELYTNALKAMRSYSGMERLEDENVPED